MYPIKFTTMNERLIAFLQAEQLTPARFAELMNIQRSGVSHLLSGRNKPGYDFFEKFVQKFPTVNLEWLISGRGKMYKEQRTSYLFPEEEKLPPQVSDVDFELYNAKYNSKTEVDEKPQPSVLERLQGEKNIQKVIILYTDGTFEAFKN